MPVTVDEKGVTTVANNTQITNNGKGPVSIKSITVTPTSGWSIVPTNTDFSKVAADTKQIGLNMFGIDVPVNGAFPVDSFKQIDGGANLALPYDSKVATQKTDITNTPVNVLFTIGWEAAPLPAPVVGTAYDDGTYKYTYGGGFDWRGVARPVVGQNGWGVQLKDSTSTAPVTKAPLVSIQGYPVTNMSWMFYHSQAVSIDLSGFDTSNVTDMADMFYYSVATTLNFPAGFGSNATDMSWMFNDSVATTLTFPAGFGSNATNMSQMFGSSAATTLTFPAGFGSNATDMTLMFYRSAATTLNFPAGFGSNATNMSQMFGSSAASTLNLPEGFGSNATNMYYMFMGSQATTLDFPAGFGSKATNMSRMFDGSKATTGYTATQSEADKWNNSTATTSKPAALTFTVKP